MENRLILLFVVSALFMLGACQDSDEYNSLQLHSSLADAALDNPKAKQLLLLMDGQDGSYERLQDCLGDNKALFEEVKTGSTFDFGPYYAIPYQNSDGVVMGSVIFPMDENVADKEKRSFVGQLGMPINLNEAYLYGQIPTVRRGLYSSRFLSWENMGMKVAPCLVQFAKELNEHTVKLSEEECQVLPQGGTRSTELGHTIVWLNYDLDSYSENGTSYAMSINTFMDIVRQKFSLQRTVSGPFYVNNVEHLGYQMLKIDLYVIDMDYYDRFAFERQVKEVLQSIKLEVMQRRFDVTMQYSYKLAAKPGSKNQHPTQGGDFVYSGSSSGTITSDSVIRQNTTEFKLDCSKNKNYQYADSVSVIMDEFTSITDEKIYANNISYSKYLEMICNDSVEYATYLSVFPNDSICTLAPASRGDKYNSEVDLRPSAVAQIHNHPNNTPPSFKDIMTTAELANEPKCPKYKATFIYNQKDSSYYALYIVDAQKAKVFHEKYNNEVDGQTNGYKKDGVFAKYLKKKKIENIDENLLYSVTTVLSVFDSGISFHRIDNTGNRITYDASKIYNAHGNIEKRKLYFSYCKY